MIDTIGTHYVIYGLVGMTVLQSVGLGVLLRRRRDLDLSRLEGRLSRFGEALALLTDTTQSGFASIAGELERTDRRAVPATTRAATSKRIATAVRRGRTVQQIAADEQVSESEIRLHLGLANPFAVAAGTATPHTPVAHDTPARPTRARRRTATAVARA